MVLCDRCLELGLGSSSVALLNKEGRIVDVQLGQLVLIPSFELITGACSWFKKKKLIKLSFELLEAGLAEFFYRYVHLHNIEIVVYDLKQAVRVMYIDYILRHHILKFILMKERKLN